MKGIVFTEFIEMVEEQFSFDMADQIITESDLASGGAYSSLGTYDHGEMLALVSNLSQATGIPAADLVRTFGRHLFNTFVTGYPEMFVGLENAFDFLLKVDSYIHMEVYKLYPDAELPRFQYEQPAEGVLVMKYASSRPFSGLAEGLIQSAIEHFGENIELQVVDVSDGAGTAAHFMLRKRS